MTERSHPPECDRSVASGCFSIEIHGEHMTEQWCEARASIQLGALVVDGCERDDPERYPTRAVYAPGTWTIVRANGGCCGNGMKSPQDGDSE